MRDATMGVAARYLQQPYARLVIPEEDGTFRAEILEFPGCIATGDTPAEALAALEDAAESWLQAALANGQSVPAPADNNEFSGRIVVRMPRSLHKKAARLAHRDGVSLNQFLVAGISEYVGERRIYGMWTATTIVSLPAGTTFSTPIADANVRAYPWELGTEGSSAQVEIQWGSPYTPGVSVRS